MKLPILAGIVLGFFFGFLIFSDSGNYKKPVSVDTPPLASLPRDQWPEHGLNAVKRGLSWGQCETCGFPVTDEDALHGFGKAVGFMDFGTYWETYVCYRHENRVLSSRRN